MIQRQEYLEGGSVSKDSANREHLGMRQNLYFFENSKKSKKVLQVSR